MQLRYLDIGELIARAGGNPWQLDGTLQDGDAGQIAELANSFYVAGVSMKETADEFHSARTSFEASWNRENGDHPINDSAEVQRATEQLKLSKEQLTRIGVDLKNIAAALAEAQRTSADAIKKLEDQLQQLDDAIGQTIARGTELYEEDLEPIKVLATQDVKDAYGTIGTARDTYAGQLSRSVNEMRAEGYGADAIDAADGDGSSGTDDAKVEGSEYGFIQQAKDRALIDSPGPMTPEKEAAAARLRDYGTISDPNADPNAVRLAGERLDDFQKTTQGGQLSPDPILGSDPVRRALIRQEYQKQLEKGMPWSPPMTPDEATMWMDQQEAIARQAAMAASQKSLQQSGFSESGAKGVVDAMAAGMSWQDVQQYAQTLGEAGADVDGRASVGRHALDGFDPDTIRSIGKAGKLVKGVGSLLEVGLAIDAVQNGAPPGATFGGLAGSIGGGWAGGAATGFIGGWALGPGGAFAGLVVGGLGGGLLGEKIGGWAGGEVYDK